MASTVGTTMTAKSRRNGDREKDGGRRLDIATKSGVCTRTRRTSRIGPPLRPETNFSCSCLYSSAFMISTLPSFLVLHICMAHRVGSWLLPLGVA